ncbi:MAG: hypothetical protein OEY01_06135 [Desulfobulbaceae bacterium]|nr:hypothetical protein [Desulfobulbaceae bacterium]HIJ78689.1 hypothetical protein [Deltaproteobacteria bacterium]
MKIILWVSFFVLFCFSSSSYAGNWEKLDKIPDDVEEIWAVIPIFSQKIKFKIPRDWESANEKTLATSYINEFLPKGQTLTSNSEMISISAYRSMSELYKPFFLINQYKNNIVKVCKDNILFNYLGETEIDGHQAAHAIIGCTSLPVDVPSVGLKKGQGEISYYLAIDGENDIYVFNKSIRTDSSQNSISLVTPENYKNFIKDIVPISLCPKEGEAAECIK